MLYSYKNGKKNPAKKIIKLRENDLYNLSIKKDTITTPSFEVTLQLTFEYDLSIANAESIANINTLARWYSKVISEYGYNKLVNNLEISVIPDSGQYMLEIKYRINSDDLKEILSSAQRLAVPDAYSKFPIRVFKPGRNSDLVFDGVEFVVGQIFKLDIKHINSNKFGKNFGLGMMGNPIPFKTK